MRALECPGDSWDSEWRENAGCDYNTNTYNGTKIAQVCGSSGGVMIDDKIEHVCMFLHGLEGDVPRYKFLAWANIKGSREVYTSDSIMTGLDTQANLDNRVSFSGQITEDTGTEYQWTSSDGNYYKVARKLSSFSKFWEIHQKGQLIGDAKCGLYSDIVAAGGSQNNWNSKAVYDALANYNNY